MDSTNRIIAIINSVIRFIKRVSPIVPVPSKSGGCGIPMPAGSLFQQSSDEMVSYSYLVRQADIQEGQEKKI